MVANFLAGGAAINALAGGGRRATVASSTSASPRPIPDVPDAGAGDRPGGRLVRARIRDGHGGHDRAARR